MNIWSPWTFGPNGHLVPSIFGSYRHWVPGIFGSNLSMGTRCVESFWSWVPNVGAPVDMGTWGLVPTPPSFGSHLNPTLTREGADYANPILMFHQVLKATGTP